MYLLQMKVVDTVEKFFTEKRNEGQKCTSINYQNKLT